MIKKISMIIVIIGVVALFIGYKLYINAIDTKYAIRFSEVFQTYDINVIDEFFSEDTNLICNGRKGTYKELRNNVVLACKEKAYKFSFGSSYGHGDNCFVEGCQEINIYLYGELNDKNFGECNLKMTLSKKGLFSFKVESIECDEYIFEYLFFGSKTGNGSLC